MPGLIESKLTAESKTTIPPGVLRALGLRPGDRLGYLIEGGAVLLVNPNEAHHHDSALEPFLTLLARDLRDHPERVRGFPRELLARITTLTADELVDHKAPIDGDVAL